MSRLALWAVPDSSGSASTAAVLQMVAESACIVPDRCGTFQHADGMSMGDVCIAADALHAHVFRRCAFCAAHAFPCMPFSYYNALSANAMLSDAFSRVGLVRRNVFGVVGN